MGGRDELCLCMEKDEQMLRRWRLMLQLPGNEAAEADLSDEEEGMAGVLKELYHRPEGKAGFSASAPHLHKWLGDIQRYFPDSQVQMMQRDAIERHGIESMLAAPEVLEAVRPDVHLVATLLSLKESLPDETRSTAERVIRAVVSALEEELRPMMLQALQGRIHRSERRSHRNPNALDWHRIIRANLKHYQPDAGGIVPEKWYSFGYRQRGLKRVMLLVDQSASMADSVVYAGIYACVLARVRSLSTQFILFDTSVVDLSEDLDDPVGVLFASQLGGGTNITRALKYAGEQIQDPGDTYLFLISDLDEGASREGMLQQLAKLRGRGVHIQVLLNLSDEGKPRFSSEMAEAVADLEISAMACTPDRFPDLFVQQLYR